MSNWITTTTTNKRAISSFEFLYGEYKLPDTINVTGYAVAG